MLSKPLYSPLQIIFFGGMASASICSVSFNGSFIDSLISFPLGALLVSVQILSVKNELYSNVFEYVDISPAHTLVCDTRHRITIATLLSFISGALAQTHKFCYSAVASSSVVLILPVGNSFASSLRFPNKHIPSARALSCSAGLLSFLPATLSLGLCAFAMPSCTHSSLVSDLQSVPNSMRK
jgi:uncharacterized membrane protein YjjP (DUF1212 family)